MNVLSLFDGMSGGQIALKEQGISVRNYYASEIDKYAIKVTKHNFPDTIQLECVTKIDVSKLKPIDLLIGGSPCTDLSIAGSMKGMSTSENENITTLEQYLKLKNKGVEFHGQSYLFWEYVRILRDIQKYNPDVLFLLENVPMKKKWERLISETLGLFSVSINSALVSAQNRNRLYWTNIRTKKVGLFGEIHSDIPQPEDKELVLKDILEENVDEKYYLSDKLIEDSLIFTENYVQWDISGKGHKSQQDRAFYPNKKHGSLTSARAAGIILKSISPYQGDIVSQPDEKSQCLPAQDGNKLKGIGIQQYDYKIRRLTPVECERLQTVPDNYTFGVSDAQRYKMLGNGWTVDVIKHIFSFINIKNKNHEKNKLKS